MADVMQGGVNADMIANINVDYTTPEDEQVLQYDSTTGLYTPTTLAGGGGGKILQVVTDKSTVSYSFPDSTFRSTGYSLAITPTSATNKILGFCAIGYKGTGGYVIGANDWYQLDSALSSGDTLTGGTRLYEATNNDGKYIDWRTGSGSDNQPVINMDFVDEGYDTTDEIYYNLVGRVPSDNWATNGNVAFTLILMEVDES
jgi:hypothetical protein